MKKENKAMLIMLAIAIMWSIAGLFIKLISWNPFVIAGFRSFFAGTTILIYMLIKKIKIKITKKSIICMFCLGITFLSFVLSNKLTTASNAIVLQFTSPIFIMLYSAVFKKQKFTYFDILAVIVIFFGISMIFADGIDVTMIIGNIFAVFTGCCMAATFISVGDCEGEEKYTGILFGQYFAAIIGLMFVPFYPPEMNVKMFLYVIILGVVQLGIPYVLLAYASKNCPPLACSLISAAEPICNPIWVALFADEYPTKYAIIGGVIVIAAVTFWCIFKDRIKASIHNA